MRFTASTFSPAGSLVDDVSVVVNVRDLPSPSFHNVRLEDHLESSMSTAIATHAEDRLKYINSSASPAIVSKQKYFLMQYFI